MSSLEDKHCSATCSSCEKGKKPGVLHIFNHRQFNENLGVDERIGTEYDVIKLEKTFGIYGVQTFTHHDLTLKNIKRKIKEISTTDFSENSCIVVVFLTHGFQNNVIAAKNKLYCFNKMILKIQSNETLKSKPKIFLIQACRDAKSNSSLKKVHKFVKASFKVEPANLNETYVVNSSTELLPSFRVETEGTPFIQLFCDIFSEYGSQKPIAEIFDLMIISVQNRITQSPEVKRNTSASYTFGDYCKDSRESASASSLSEDSEPQIQNISKLSEINGNDISCNIQDLSELELSDDDFIPPIQNIIENVSENLEFAKENNQLTINQKSEQFIAKFKSEVVDTWEQVCPCGHSPMPKNPVLGGTDLDGHPIYIARTIWNFELLPAKASIERKHAFVAYCGLEHKTTDFEVLTGTGYSWVADSRGNVPSNAVKGGVTSDGEILYIGRTAHDTTVTPGKIHPSHRFLYIPFDGLEVRFFHYEVLVK